MAQSFRARRPFKGVGGIRQRQANLRWLRRSRKGVQSDSRPVLRIGGLPLFDFGKVAVGALQLLTPLPAVVVACRLKNFTEAMLGRLAFPGFCIAAFIILRCNENCIAPQQVSDRLGNDGARGHESGNVPKDWRALAQ
jgi:hypothetical protein